jgi:hypothetical protein
LTFNYGGTFIHLEKKSHHHWFWIRRIICSVLYGKAGWDVREKHENGRGQSRQLKQALCLIWGPVGIGCPMFRKIFPQLEKVEGTIRFID